MPPVSNDVVLLRCLIGTPRPAQADNLLCDLSDIANPQVKVGDLGLSKQKATTFVSGNMRGTLPWMAPEVMIHLRPSLPSHPPTSMRHPPLCDTLSRRSGASTHRGKPERIAGATPAASLPPQLFGGMARESPADDEMAHAEDDGNVTEKVDVFSFGVTM